MAGVPSLARSAGARLAGWFCLLLRWHQGQIDLEQQLHRLPGLAARNLPSSASVGAERPNRGHRAGAGAYRPPVFLASLRCPPLPLRLQRELSSDSFRLYTNSDPVGTDSCAWSPEERGWRWRRSRWALDLGTKRQGLLAHRGLAEMASAGGLMGGAAAPLRIGRLGDLALATANSFLEPNYRFGA